MEEIIKDVCAANPVSKNVLWKRTDCARKVGVMKSCPDYWLVENHLFEIVLWMGNPYRLMLLC